MLIIQIKTLNKISYLCLIVYKGHLYAFLLISNQIKDVVPYYFKLETKRETQSL